MEYVVVVMVVVMEYIVVVMEYIVVVIDTLLLCLFLYNLTGNVQTLYSRTTKHFN